MTTSPSRLLPADGAFGTLLRVARHAHGLQVHDLAVAANMTRGYVSRLERAERQPSRRSVEALALALGMGPIERDRMLYAAGYAPSIAYMRVLVGNWLITEAQ